MESSVILHKNNKKDVLEYSEIIIDKTGCDLLRTNNFDLKETLFYKTIIFATYIKSNKLNLSSYIEKNWDYLKNRNIIIFCVTTHKKTSKELNQVLENSFTKDIRNKILFYPLYGVVPYHKLNPLEKVKFFIKKEDYYAEIDEDQTYKIVRAIKHPHIEKYIKTLKLN